jgi:hypothetical protein
VSKYRSTSPSHGIMCMRYARTVALFQRGVGFGRGQGSTWNGLSRPAVFYQALSSGRSRLATRLIPTLVHFRRGGESALSGWAKTTTIRPRSTDPVENSQRAGRVRGSSAGQERVLIGPSLYAAVICVGLCQPATEDSSNSSGRVCSHCESSLRRSWTRGNAHGRSVAVCRREVG